MNLTHSLRFPAIAACFIALVAMAGCSRPAPEERLIDVGEAVDDAEQQLRTINAEIAEHLDAVADLRKQRQRAQASLMTLEERLEKRATDLAIFRAAQAALLQDEQLQDAAVLANVEDQVVTLTGSVRSPAEQQAAKRVVESVPGVDRIVIRLDIVDDPDAGSS